MQWITLAAEPNPGHPKQRGPTMRLKNRRATYLVGATAGIAALLAGCATTPQDSGPQTIVFAGYASAAGAFEARADAFHEAHDDITVEVQGIPANSWGELLQAISVNIAGGESPDVADIASEGQRAFIDSGLIAPIDDYLARDADELQETLDDIDPRLLESLQVDGTTYGLPTVWNSMVIYYNKNVLEAAGLEAPTEDWTIDDFIEMSQQVVASSGGESYGYAFSPGYFTTLMPWMLQTGGSVLSDDWSESRLAEPETIEAVQLLHDFVHEYGISPQLDAGVTDTDLFTQNKLAFMGAGMWQVNALRNAGFTPEDYDVVKFPAGSQSRTLIGVGAAPIFAAGAHQEAAWEFAKFLSSKEFQETFVVQDGWSIPATRGAFELMLEQDFFPDNGAIFYDLLDEAVLVPAPAQYGDIESALVREFTAAMSDGKTVEQAMTDADAAVNGALAR